MKTLFLITFLIGNMAFAEKEKCNCPVQTCKFKHIKTSQDSVDVIFMTHDMTKPIGCETER